jgi:hypothetical protein
MYDRERNKVNTRNEVIQRRNPANNDCKAPSETFTVIERDCIIRYFSILEWIQSASGR